VFSLALLLALPILIGAGRDSYRDPYSSREATRQERLEKKPRIYYAVRSSEERPRSRSSTYNSRPTKSFEELPPLEEEEELEEERDYEEETPRSTFRKPSPVYSRNTESSRERPERVTSSSSYRSSSSDRASPERSISSERERTIPERERDSEERFSNQPSSFRASPVDDYLSPSSATKSRDCLQTQLLTALTENKMLLKQQQEQQQQQRQQQQQQQQQQKQQQTRQQQLRANFPASTYSSQSFAQQRALPTMPPPQVYINKCPNRISKLSPEKTSLLNWIMKNGQHKIFARSTRSVPQESSSRNRRDWTPLIPFNNSSARVTRSSYYSSSSYTDPYGNYGNQQQRPQQYSMPIISPQPSLPRAPVPNYAVLDSEFVSVGDFKDANEIVNKLKTEFPPMEQSSVPVIGGGDRDSDYTEEEENREEDYEENPEEEDFRSSSNKYSYGKMKPEEEEMEMEKYETNRPKEENKYERPAEKERGPMTYEAHEREEMTPQSYEEKTREELRKYSAPEGASKYYGTSSSSKPKETGYSAMRPEPEVSTGYSAMRPEPEVSTGYKTGTRTEEREEVRRPALQARLRKPENTYREKETFSHQIGPNGSYNVEYSTGNIQSKEKGYLKTVKSRTNSQSVRSQGQPEEEDTVANVKMGSVSWTSPDGYTFHLTYEADENGYRPLLTQTSMVPSNNIRSIDRRSCWSIADNREIMLPEEERSSSQSTRSSSGQSYGNSRSRKGTSRASKPQHSYHD
ncbi:unnamed protein product, partial [Allacma fusca]